MELIHIMSYLRGQPLEEKDGRVTLFAEAWRDRNVKKSASVKINMELDLYLDCLNVSDDEDLLLSFCTEDCWKSLLKVFENPHFAFVVNKDFQVMLEDEDTMITLKEF